MSMDCNFLWGRGVVYCFAISPQHCTTHYKCNLNQPCQGLTFGYPRIRFSLAT